jgi:transposase
MLANHPNIQTQDVASTLEIHPFMLSRWKKEWREGKLKLGKSTTAPPVSDLTEAGRRIRELERENAQLREENDLLKKLEPSDSRTKKQSSRSSRSTGGGSK